MLQQQKRNQLLRQHELSHETNAAPFQCHDLDLQNAGLTSKIFSRICICRKSRRFDPVCLLCLSFPRMVWDCLSLPRMLWATLHFLNLVFPISWNCQQSLQQNQSLSGLLRSSVVSHRTFHLRLCFWNGISPLTKTACRFLGWPPSTFVWNSSCTGFDHNCRICTRSVWNAEFSSNLFQKPCVDLVNCLIEISTTVELKDR